MIHTKFSAMGSMIFVLFDLWGLVSNRHAEKRVKGMTMD